MAIMFNGENLTANTLDPTFMFAIIIILFIIFIGIFLMYIMFKN